MSASNRSRRIRRVIGDLAIVLCLTVLPALLASMLSGAVDGDAMASASPAPARVA